MRSVVGHTYCARTGRRLTGQIAESFVISDWTEVLTGTYRYSSKTQTPVHIVVANIAQSPQTSNLCVCVCVASFSWLSGQVHRCHAVLVKGNAVLPFHQEFHRLNSSSTPVPGFASYESVPRNLTLYIYNSACVSQKCNDSDVLESGDTQTANTQTPVKAEPGAKLVGTQHPQLDLAEDCIPRSCVWQAKDITSSSTSAHFQSQEEISHRDSSSSDPISDSLMSTIHSELSSLTITNHVGQVPESNLKHMAPPLSRKDMPPCLTNYLKPEVVIGGGVKGPGTWQRQRYILLEAARTVVRPNMPRQDWSCPPNLKPRVKFQSTCSQALSPSLPVKKDRNAGFPSFLTHAKEHILKTPQASFHRTQVQEQANWYCQRSRFLSHQSVKSTLSAPAQYMPGSMLLAPDSGAKHDTQDRPSARRSSIRGAYEARQQANQRLFLVPLRFNIKDRRHILKMMQEH